MVVLTTVPPLSTTSYEATTRTVPRPPVPGPTASIPTCRTLTASVTLVITTGGSSARRGLFFCFFSLRAKFTESRGKSIQFEWAGERALRTVGSASCRSSRRRASRPGAPWLAAKPPSSSSTAHPLTTRFETALLGRGSALRTRPADHIVARASGAGAAVRTHAAGKLPGCHRAQLCGGTIHAACATRRLRLRCRYEGAELRRLLPTVRATPRVPTAITRPPTPS